MGHGFRVPGARSDLTDQTDRTNETTNNQSPMTHHPQPNMLTDSHQHVYWNSRGDQGLIDDIDAHGIDLTWLLTWEIAPAEDNPLVHGDLNPIWLRPDGTHAGIVLSDL